MAKELRCGDILRGCNHVIRAETEHEVMAKGAQHARDAHGIEQLDAATAEKVRGAIRDV